MATPKERKGPDKFLGYILIALGIFGAIAKFYTHQSEWKTGSIVKLCLIIGAFGYGLWIVFKKKSN